MEFARKEHKKASKTVKAVPKKNADVPVWFNQSISKEEASLEEQQELEELLKVGEN